ncbi:hypothetical protein AB3A32_002608 [Vibrio alginolyticus]
MTIIKTVKFEEKEHTAIYENTMNGYMITLAADDVIVGVVREGGGIRLYEGKFKTLKGQEFAKELLEMTWVETFDDELDLKHPIDDLALPTRDYTR